MKSNLNPRLSELTIYFLSMFFIFFPGCKEEKLPGDIPEVSGPQSTAITESGASLSGKVNPNHLETNVFFEYGLSTEYGETVQANENPLKGSTETNVSVTLTGLDPASTYHYRINATNEYGTSLSSDAIFVTLGSVPTLGIPFMTEITQTTAIIKCPVNPNYFATSIKVEYGTDTGYGRTKDANESPLSGNSSDTVTIQLTDLTELTGYHLRIISENQLGSSYSNDFIFSTFGTLTDYDGNIYKTIKIGSQTWMAENLRTTHFSDATEMYYGNNTSNVDDMKKYYFVYAGNNDLVPVYGLLYNYYAASNSEPIVPNGSDLIPSGIQGACPTGWHLPSRPEWAELVDYLGGSDIAGGKLKSVDLWKNPNTGATDESQFHAVPSGGYNKPNYGFGYIGEIGFIWGTSGDSDYFGGIELNYNKGEVVLNVGNHRNCASPVRCLKD